MTGRKWRVSSGSSCAPSGSRRKCRADVAAATSAAAAGGGGGGSAVAEVFRALLERAGDAGAAGGRPAARPDATEEAGRDGAEDSRSEGVRTGGDEGPPGASGCNLAALSPTRWWVSAAPRAERERDATEQAEDAASLLRTWRPVP